MRSQSATATPAQTILSSLDTPTITSMVGVRVPQAKRTGGGAGVKSMIELAADHPSRTPACTGFHAREIVNTHDTLEQPRTATATRQTGPTREASDTAPPLPGDSISRAKNPSTPPWKKSPPEAQNAQFRPARREGGCQSGPSGRV